MKLSFINVFTELYLYILYLELSESMNFPGTILVGHFPLGFLTEYDEGRLGFGFNQLLHHANIAMLSREM